MFYLKVVVAAAFAMLAWLSFVVVTALYGWWHDPIAPPGQPRVFMDAAMKIIQEEARGNLALILIVDGEIYDEYYAASAGSVDRDTIFPTASMSKWLTAWGVMKLVQEGRVDLDQPVNAYLTRWKLPDGEFETSGVTVRRLLSHTSGLTDGLGFGDYEPGEVLPSLEASLAHPRASRGREVRITIGAEPGTEFEYSGGGYLILQLLIEEVSGESFAAYMHKTIFQPLGMSRATYGYIGEMDNVSASYDADGNPATLYQYASSAATGFAASAADVARLVIAQTSGAPSVPLTQTTISSMRQPHASVFGLDLWGLGTILYGPTGAGDFVFGHDGGNDPAINSSARVNPDTQDGIVVLETGNLSLATRIGSHWTFWQTGYPDNLTMGQTLKDVVPGMIAGCLLIPAGVVAWIVRRRRKAAA